MVISIPVYSKEKTIGRVINAIKEVMNKSRYGGAQVSYEICFRKLIKSVDKKNIFVL